MFIAETDSTNDLLRKQYLDEADLFTIQADYQTAGRGQHGNGWESEKGKNLLFSTLLRDWNIPVARQFVLNEVVSLSVYHAVRQLLIPHTDTDNPEMFTRLLRIKWPNDLYYADRKLAGILIENIWSGNMVSRTIAGIGLNVNQTIFRSSAHNPISLCQIVEKEIGRDTLLQQFIVHLRQYRQILSSDAASTDTIHAEYLRTLYRREGSYWWEEREVSLSPSMPQTARKQGQFLAGIDTVLPSGELVLLTEQNERRTYHFKQVRYVLPS